MGVKTTFQRRVSAGEVISIDDIFYAGKPTVAIHSNGVIGQYKAL